MTQTTKSEIPEHIIYFDSEARVDTDDTKYIAQVLAGDTVEKIHDPYLICACFSRSRRDTWKDYHGRNFKRRFWREVDRWTQEGRKTWIFAHNAKYDTLAAGAVHWLVKMGYTVLGFSDDNPFILKLAKKVNDKRKTILILSSTNYYKNSLAELGTIFGLPKLDAAFNAPLRDAITYCRRDVEILKLAMDHFINFIRTEDLGNFAQTIAGQAFSSYRHRFMHHDIYIHVDRRALEIEREAYSGGRTEAWRIGVVPEKMFVCDVNSQYPFVMMEKSYPVMLKTIRNTMDLDTAAAMIEKGYLLIGRASIDTADPIFPVKAGRLIFPVGKFETTLTTPEISAGIARGIITSLKDVCIYEGGKIFMDYVDYFYNARLEAKAKGDKVHDLMYKLFLNSLYGKFGQRAIDWEAVGEAPPDVVSVEQIFDVDTQSRRLVKIFGGTIFKSIPKQGVAAEAANSFPAVAAHVTAYARMLLWSYIEIAGFSNVAYMDTDSLFVNEAGLERLQAAGVLDPTRLGALKLEKEGQLTIYGVKDYVFDGKAKIKGISKNAIKISETDYIVNQWASLSTMLRDGTTDGYKNMLVKKHLSREYTKGNIMPGGWVAPLIMDGGIFEPDPAAVNLQVLRVNYCKDELKYEQQQQREIVVMEQQMKKEIRKLIVKMGGINDRDYESIPKWARRLHGFTMSEIAQELNVRGYPLRDGEELYQMIQGL
ncbi:MAG: hypothetical protein M0P69_19620 [Bacteroidales bacterium]|nr:hypothetical protein [Bacteroidales bacterium]